MVHGKHMARLVVWSTGLRHPMMAFLLQLLHAVFYLCLLVQAFTCLVQIYTLTDFSWLVLSVTKGGKSPTMIVDFLFFSFTFDKFDF